MVGRPSPAVFKDVVHVVGVSPPPGGSGERPDCHFPEEIESVGPIPAPIRGTLLLIFSSHQTLEFIGFGAMDVTKPYEFTGFGAMDVTKAYEFIGFGALTRSGVVARRGEGGGPKMEVNKTSRATRRARQCSEVPFRLGT